MEKRTWYVIDRLESIPSPALIVYPDRVRSNIRRAIEIAGGPERLRPHIKTHKSAEVIRMHLELGVTRFKCSTIAETEMAAGAGAKDLLLANQLTGPNLARFQALREAFPAVTFSAICDNEQTLGELSRLSASSPGLPVYVDIDCGMHRTGIEPSEEALRLYEEMTKLPGVRAAGLHAYDGHIHEPDLTKRREQCDDAFAGVQNLRKKIEQRGMTVPTIVAGGTPTFPIHAKHADREYSPGTYVYWDFGYEKFADLDFQIAALVIARVISRPAANRLCLDLGHKAIAAENPPPRVQFLNLPDANAVMHSEEHLVVETAEAANWKVGDVLYGIPRHICPTVALHDLAYPVENGQAGKPWEIQARKRRLSI